MSQIDVERFLGRLITDADFRTKAADSVAKVCFSEGITLSAAEMSLLNRIDSTLFGRIAETLDDSIQRT